MPHKTLTIVLAGGTGTRLKPLTTDRAKPAVPFGGKYRIIDFCLANCLHSGMRQVLVLTQYKSHSLQKHLRDGWSIFNPEIGEFITPVPPQMRTGDRWYQGTSDAISQNRYLLERSGAREVLILSADHIYRMDYATMLEFHRASHADLTISSVEVAIDKAREFGVLAVDAGQRVTGFAEKPANPSPVPGDAGHALVSMGIYVFSLELLLEALAEDQMHTDSTHDFGNDIIPRLIGRQRVMSYRFGGPDGRVIPDRYWRDVGAIDAYYRANVDLLEPVPALDLYQEDWPIRSYQLQTPPARTVPGPSGAEGISINSIVAGGTVVAGASVQHSVLFPKVRVGDEALVEESILFQGVRVGDRVRLRRCIVDKHVEIPAGEQIGYNLERDRERFTVSEEGVVVVPKRHRFGH